MKFSMDDITLGEMIDVEEELGKPLSVVFEEGQAKATAVVAWILKRRDDPTFTLADARRLTIADLNAMGVTDASPGEAPGGGNGLSPPASPAPGLLTPSP